MKYRASSKAKPECYKKCVKGDGGNFKVWGCFSANGLGSLHIIYDTLTGAKYKEILEEHLFKDANKMQIEDDYYFQHDNDPKHTSKIVKNWLAEKEVQTIHWPSCSPDLNPIDNMWSILKNKISERSPINNIESLKTIAQEEWLKLNEDKELLRNLSNSMPNRIDALKKVKGGHTGY